MGCELAEWNFRRAALLVVRALEGQYLTREGSGGRMTTVEIGLSGYG